MKSRPRPAWTGQPGAVAAAVAVIACATLLAACGSGRSASNSPTGPSTTHASPSTPAPSQTSGVNSASGRPDHVVVVVFENKSSHQIDGDPQAPYLNSLLAKSAVLTDSRAVAHPSQPNYLALFSGSVQGVFDDRCLTPFGDRPNLGAQLITASYTFVGYSEGLPRAGFTGCHSDRYAAKHNPWVNFSNLTPAVNQPLSAFPTDLRQLPTVAFVVPDLCGDMHDCSISMGDSWARDHLDAYAQWARGHNSLLVVTFDEDDNQQGNHILTFITGAGVRPGRYGGQVTHYSVLGLLEDLYGLPRLGAAATAAPIAGAWR